MTEQPKITFPSMASIQFFAERFKEVEPSAVDAFVSVVRVATQFQTEMETYFHARDLSYGRFMTMMCLMKNDGARVTPGDLAETLGVKRATVTGILDTLAAQGWIERVPDPDDRRAVLVTLNDAGRKKLRGMLPAHYKMVSNVMKTFSESDRKALKSLMVRFATAIEVISSENDKRPAGQERDDARS